LKNTESKENYNQNLDKI